MPVQFFNKTLMERATLVISVVLLYCANSLTRLRLEKSE